MNINDLPDREAMGLPKEFFPAIKDNINDLYEEFRSLQIDKLVNIVESLQYDVKQRFVAGQILALIGDPRISTYEPNMIDVPSAEITIGIDENDISGVLESFPNIGLQREWILKETPKFITKIDNFKISKYLITNQEFKEFLTQTRFKEIPSSWEFGMYPENKANHPVYTISFNAAEEYVKWLSAKTGRVFKLPSEYEWEYAASGKQHYQFPWGDKYENNYANTLESKFFSSTPVGIFVEGFSEFGLADMAGNVEEYVNDNFTPYANSKFTNDDIGNKLGNYKVCRGGSFTRYADLSRCTRRHGAYPKNIYVIGFRLAEII